MQNLGPGRTVVERSDGTERVSVWIDRERQVYARTEARPDSPNMPFMVLGGGRKKVVFGIGKGS